MTTFSIKFDKEQYREGDTNIQFRIEWDGPVSAVTKLKWDIVFSGVLPTTPHDFPTGGLTGTQTIQTKTAKGSMVVTLNVKNDTVFEPIEDLVVRLSLASDNANSAATIGDALASTKLADNDLYDDGEDPPYYPYYPSAPWGLISSYGDNNDNILVIGHTAEAIFGGQKGNDQYIVTRYQTFYASIYDRSGDDIIRFDDGVEIKSASLGADKTTGLITFQNGSWVDFNSAERWKFQLGEGEVMGWEVFKDLGSTTVSGYLGGTITPSASGSTWGGIAYGVDYHEDIFTFGQETQVEVRSSDGADTYIVTRFQSGNLILYDGDDGDLLKFDVGVEIKSVNPIRTYLHEVYGVVMWTNITLQNGAVIQIDSPTTWTFQFGDDEVMSWADFVDEVSGGYSVPFGDGHVPLNGNKHLVVTTFSASFTEADGYREGDTIKFRIEWDGATAAETKLKWDIVHSGSLPTSASDFGTDGTSGTKTIQTQTGKGYTDITLDVKNDTDSEPIEDLVVRLSLADDNVNRGAKIGIAEANTELADNDLLNGAPKYHPYRLSGTHNPFSLRGDSGDNVFTLGYTMYTYVRGRAGDDEYIITRYQAANTNIGDTSGTDTLRFDDGVEIKSAGLIGSKGLIVLQNGSRLTINSATRWKFQLGTDDIVGWTDFMGLAPITVSGYLSASTGASTSLSAPLYRGATSSAREDIYTFGEESDATPESSGGSDTYIVTRFQSGDLTLTDGSDNDILKFDAGVAIKSASVSGGKGKITLQNDAVITIDHYTDWKFQFGDGVVMGWTAFSTITKLAYTVPLGTGFVSTDNDAQLVEGSLIDNGAEGRIFLRDGTGYSLSVTRTTRKTDVTTDGSAISILSENETLVAGTYGTLHVKKDGTWRYELNNQDADTKALKSGETVYETFGFTYADKAGSFTETLTISIEGRKDITVSTATPANYATSTDNLVIHNENRTPNEYLSATGNNTDTRSFVFTGGTGTLIAGSNKIDISEGKITLLYGLPISFSEERGLSADAGTKIIVREATAGNDVWGVHTATRTDIDDLIKAGTPYYVLGTIVDGEFKQNDTKSTDVIYTPTIINTGSGNDIILSSTTIRGIDRISSGAGNDELHGGGGNDVLKGEGGNDILRGGARNDVLDGGSGIDEVQWVKSVNIQANLSDKIKWKFNAYTQSWESNTGAGYDYIRVWIDSNNNRLSEETKDEFDYLKDIENLTGGDKNDTLIGDRHANILIGGNGDDTLDGDLGRDVLRGDGGNDIFVLNLQATSNGDIDIVTDFGAGNDKIRVDIASTATTLDALKSAAKLRWTNNTDYSALSGITAESTNDASVNDTIIYDTQGTSSISDDIVLMVLENYNTALTIGDFDII